MKRLISLISATVISMGGIDALAANMEFVDAVQDAYIISEDMIYGIDDDTVTADRLADNLFNYEETSSNTQLASSAFSTDVGYIVDFGENAPAMAVFRTFIAGDGVKGGITISGSADDVTFTELAKASKLTGGEWNELRLDDSAAYRYIKVEPQKAEVQNETEDSAAVETTNEDEEESTSEIVNETEEGEFSAARAVKSVFIAADDSQTDDDSATTQIGDGVGAAGGLGFSGSKFPDCRGHWAEEIIKECTDKKYLDGYEDGTFHPDAPVTAAEFAKIYSAWGNKFYIVNDGYWAMPFIRDMLEDGIFENGDFDDYNAYMTREECAKAIVNSLGAEYFPSDMSTFEQYIKDIADVDEEYREYVLKSYVSGIITGYEDGTYNPKGYVTRAEILTLIDRAKDETKRLVPDVVSESAMGKANIQIYYNAAVQVRKSSNANNMNFRLYGKNAQYMTEDDTASGLKLYDEFQGAQGMAFLMRFDLSSIVKREESLKSVQFVINRHSNGDMPIGLFWYEYGISKTDWNNSDYMQVVNNSAVAADNKAGYNSVCDNISALLPTWGKPDEAVPDEEKTKPFIQSSLNTVTNQYVFNLDWNELKEHMDENNIVEFFVTTVNYDKYGMDNDNKPRCYTAGENAPQLYCSFDTDETSEIKLMPEEAELFGGMLNLSGSERDKHIENFTKGQIITYNLDIPRADKYNIKINYSANQGSGGGSAVITVNGEETEHEFAQTGSWTTYIYEDLGVFELKAGTNTIAISDKLIPNTFLINIKDIVIEPVEEGE